jgi:hypothetical protein
MRLEHGTHDASRELAGTALNVARELERQAAEETSLLKCGRFCSSTINIRILGAWQSTEGYDAN